MATTGWRGSGYDGRDYRWDGVGAMRPTASLVVPFGPRDQGKANCCVAVAIVTAMEVLDARQGTAQRLSPLFNYFVSRTDPAYTGRVGIREGLNAAVQFGVCTSSMHESTIGPDGPYLRTDALVRPTPAAYADAKSHRLLTEDPNWNRLGYYNVDGPGRVSAWRSALEHGSPVVFGFFATQSYQRMSTGESCRVSDTSSDHGSSGHAVVATGYDGEWFRIRDSRGSRFAERGDWFLHSTIVEQPWVHESWAIAAIGYDT